MNITGQATILKDDKGIYKTSLSTKELTESGEEQSVFMRINVGFRKGIDVKHKTKINITNGFLTFFRIPTGNTNEDGQTEYKRFPKIIVMDFEVLEDGVDEVYQSKNYSNKQNNFSDDTMGEYYSETIDDLPF